MADKSSVREWAVTRSLKEMDIVYPVKKGVHNEPLRYSLRSLVNFPHRRVWLVGYSPPWLGGCGHIPEPGGKTSTARMYNAVLAAATHPAVSDPFVLFNDDFFVTAPVSKLPPAYVTTLRKHVADPHLQSGEGPWKDSLIATLELLESLGVKNPLSYEIHLPMVFDKKILAELMAPYASDHPPQLRSLYGNLAQIGGSQRADVKALGKGKDRPLNTPFHSTYEVSFAEFEQRLKEMFPTPSPYERAAAARLVLAAALQAKSQKPPG